LRGIIRRLRAGSITGNVRTLTSVALASIAVPTAIGLQAAPAADAATVPPTVTSAFTPNLIGVGDTDATALSVTITNPNASGTLSSVAFSDTLPTGLTVDNPNGENGTCGTAGVITATPGSSALSLTGGSIKAGAACTISVSLVASQTGTLTNTTGLVGSSAGSSSAGDTETLTVLPPPTVSVSGIRNNATYTFGESVRPRYTCTQPADAAALADCSAADDLGNAVASGGALDTKDPGSHTLTVSATSSDGLETDDSVTYTVLPDNQFTVAKVKPGKNGTLAFELALPGAGPVKVVELAGKTTFGTYNRTVAGKKTINVTVRPTSRGRSLLTASSATKPRVKITLEITYTPKGGVKRTVTKRGIVLS
jgi:hypothetical protein